MNRVLTAFLLVTLAVFGLFAQESEMQADARNAAAAHSVTKAPPADRAVDGLVAPPTGLPYSLVDGPAYGADVFGNAWLRIPLANPAGAANLGPANGDYYCGDFDDNGTFALIDNATSTLALVDTATGAVTPVGAITVQAGHTWTGLTWDTQDGTWYASSTDGASAAFYEVDPAGPTATLLATSTTVPLIIDIAAAPDGTIWGHDISLDAIVTLDKNNGWVSTTVGPTGFDGNFAQGMDFNPASGDLYLAAYNNATSTGELRLVDQTTGGTTVIGFLGAGTNVEVGAFGIAGSAADDADPNPPANFTAYSDYNTPTGMMLTWDDPTTLVDGTPIASGDFTIEVERDGAAIASVAGGTGSYMDAGLTDGQLYEYSIYAKLTANDSTSNAVTTSWIAGGAGTPNAPTGLSVAVETNGDLTLSWTNPSTNIDGTPMDDFAGINVYENGSLFATYTRTSADTGAADTETFTPGAGTNAYTATAIDNESPANESAPAGPVFSPLGLPFSDDFPTAGVPNPGFWFNSDGEVTDFGVNPPSPNFALTLDGFPHATPEVGDTVTLKPLDLTGQGGNGLVVAYWYQPQGTQNAPETADILAVDFKNDQGQWVEVRQYPGTPLVPFAQEVISIDGENPGAGATFFHNQFQFRFRNVATVSTTDPFDHWLIDDVYVGEAVGNPDMVVAPQSISDSALVNGTVVRDFEIRNAATNVSNLNYTVTEDPAASWLTLSQTSGTLSSGTSDVISVTMDATGLAAGTYTTDLIVAGNDVNNAEDTVAVTFEVRDAPVVGFSPDSLIFVDFEPDSVDSMMLTISNNGSGPLFFTLTDEDVFTSARIVHRDLQRYPAHFYGRETAKADLDSRRGFVPTEGLGGPDNFGYRWIDSDEPGGPTFNWIDITGTGTSVSLTDDDFVEVTLPFTFEFYGQPKTAVKIGSNGYLTFGGDGTDFSNDAIPDAVDPNDIIAPFWDDLNPADGGTIHYLATATEFIVQYTDINHYSGGGEIGTYTFQVILKSNGQMLFQYLTLSGVIDSQTIGIENSDASDGLEVVFNASYVHDNLAIRIAADSPWLSENPNSGTVPAGGSVDVQVIVNTTGLLGGNYAANVLIESNDPVTPVETVPVRLNVLGTPILDASPDPVVFGDPVFVNGTATEVLTVTNSGNIALSVTDITSSNTDFSAAPTSFSVDPFQSVDVTVTFSPAAAGPSTGTLTLVSNDPAAPNYDVAVEGTGVLAPEFAFGPDTLRANLAPGDSADLLLTMENVAPTGAADLVYEARLATTAAAMDLVRAIDPERNAMGSAPVSLGKAPAANDGTDAATGNEDLRDLLSSLASNAYGADVFGGSWLRIPLANPGGAVQQGIVTGSWFAGDFDDAGTFAAIDNDNGNLVLVDTANGTGTVVGALTGQAGHTWTGLTWDTQDQAWYASSTDGATAAFYLVDPAGPTATLLATSTTVPLIIDISASPTGDIYGHDISTDAIHFLDKNNGWVDTQIGPTGFDANFAQGMDFDPESGLLYLAAYNNATSAGELRLVDLATGGTTLIGPLGTGTNVEVCAFGIPGAPPATWARLLDPTSGTIAPGDVAGLTVRVYGLLGSGADTTYVGAVECLTNDPLNPTVMVPLVVSVGITGIGDTEVLPTTYAVSQNYPNPFNPTTTISYQLPKASDVNLVIYNVLGQQVRTLVKGRMEAGSFDAVWDGRNNAGVKVSSGVYIYRFEAGDFTRVRKMMLLK